MFFSGKQKTATTRYEVDGDQVVLTKPVSPIPQVTSKTPEFSIRNDHVKYLLEYEELAKLTGLNVKPMFNQIEKFTVLLAKLGITVFSLSEVRTYMDNLAKTENPYKSGWNWCPLRKKDQVREIEFGRQSWNNGTGINPASDYFSGARYSKNRVDSWGNSQGPGEEPASSNIYDKQIPLHALRKVAMIEKSFKGDVPPAFFVSDYATAPAMLPDPFLMVLISNAELNKDVGRFVIDVWDEPGFGLESQLK